MNAKTNPTKRGQDILAQIGQIPIIVQGKLSERRQGGRVTGIKLQRWRNGRNETRHVPADLVETVRQGTRGYAHFMALAREYVEHREAEVWGDGADSKKKKPTRP
jgi:hypothetical protein